MSPSFSRTTFSQPASSREAEHVPHISCSRTHADQVQWSLTRLCQTPMAPMRIARAAAEHLDTVLGLIEDARNWLWTKDTDQWATPWPDKETRDARIFEGIQAGRTWILWHGEIPAATVTITSRPNLAVWSRPAREGVLYERAVYLHRLITARDYAGWGLGAELIDWAGLRGQREWAAKWIRIDVWTSNIALHEYYLRTGFERCGSCTDPAYPSGALFQKRISKIGHAGIPQFTGSWTEIDPGAARIPAFA
jgi:GNAT superfamily N-acetyltransferase